MKLLTGLAPGQALLGAANQHVRHLGVGLVALAGRGHDDDAALAIGGDNVADLAHLAGIGQRRSTEFADLHGYPLKIEY